MSWLWGMKASMACRAFWISGCVIATAGFVTVSFFCGRQVQESPYSLESLPLKTPRSESNRDGKKKMESKTRTASSVFATEKPRGPRSFLCHGAMLSNVLENHLDFGRVMEFCEFFCKILGTSSPFSRCRNHGSAQPSRRTRVQCVVFDIEYRVV